MFEEPQNQMPYLLFVMLLPKIILLDEVDGISGRADAGGLEAILELIKITRHPIVMTANDPWDPKLRPLRGESELIEFKRLPKTTIINILKKICLAEGLKCDYNALSYIAGKSEGDLRSAINDLEAIGRAYNHVTLTLVKAMVRPRDREHTPFEALRNLFTSRHVWQAKMAITQANVDYETMMQWINENIPYQLTDPEDLWRAYESLSRADQYFGRIRKSGSWDLLAYVFDLMGPGVALARKKTRYKWVKYSFPQKILLMSKTKQVREIRDALARHIASRILTSSAVVKSDVLPYLKVIFENNPLYAARLAIGLELTENMIKYLAGPKASEVISYVRRLKSGKIPPSMIKRIK